MDRLPGEIHDHAVFWIGVVGVVGWGLLAGTLAAMVWPRLDDALRPKLESHRVWATAMVTAAAALLIGGQIWRTLDWSGEPTGSAAQVRQLYAGTTEALRVQRVSRPLVRIQSEVWAESAGTVLQLYKDGMPFAVERRWLHMDGPPLAAYGCEVHPLPALCRCGRPRLR